MGKSDDKLFVGVDLGGTNVSAGACDFKNKVIAKEYDISPRTVEVYRANVMTKMQAGNLSELVRFAIRAGIVED